MRIIIADSGQEFESNNTFLKTLNANDLNNLKQEIADRTQIKPSNQILITPSGLQIKVNNEVSNKDMSDTLVLFNRKLLLDPSSLLPVQETKQQHPTTAIPSLKELEDMLITLDNNEEGGTLKIKETTRVIIQTCKDRKELIEKLTREISAQSIALNSALNNLESHVETAHQNVRKFDRIAQREFAKDAIAIASVDLEIELLQQINLHPRVIKNMTKPVSSNALSLADFVPITQLQTIKKTSLLKEYDELVSATLEQNNKMAHLNQQTANACVHRTTSEAVIGRVTKIKQQVNRFVDVLIDLEKKIFEELENKRTTETSENAIAVDSPSSADTPFLPHSPPFLDAKGKRYFSSSSDIHASTSPHTIPLLSPPLLPTYSTRRKRMKGKKDIIGDGMRLFYLYDQLICDSENNVLEEKKKTFEGFIYRMQSISQVEQSITQIYPKLAELEKRIKWLRFEIERGQGALARKVITGYGMLLCELWRRDTYSEIVMKNTHLLGELFAQFGKMEEKYRRNFIENEIVCLEEREDQHILSHIQQNQQQSIIPFLIQDLNSAPVICQTSTTISNKEQNTISKKDVETYIQMVHSFYVNYNHDNKEQNNTVLSFDVSSMLSRKLEREAKRLNKGLAQLGLPSTNNNNSSNKKHVQLNNVPTKDLNSSSKNSTQNDSNTMNRNATFSSPPSSPVMNDKSKDWELDRTLILNQFQEYKEHIKLFQLKHEQYEKEKQNLLDELNHKERCIEEIQIEHQQEIQNLLQMVEAKEASQQNEIRKPLLSPPQEEQVRYIQSAPTTPYPQNPISQSVLNEHEKKIVQQLRFDHAQEIQQLQQRWKAERAAQLQKFRDVQEHDHADVISLVNALEAQKNQLLDQLTQAKDALLNNSMLSHHNDDDIGGNKNVDHSSISEEKEMLRKEIDALQTDARQAVKEKDTLQKEIQQLRAEKDQLYKDFTTFKKHTNHAAIELIQLRKEQASAKRIANDLLSISQTQTIYSSVDDDNVSLIDILKRTQGNVTILQTHVNVLEQSVESSYLMGTYPYGI